MKRGQTIYLGLIALFLITILFVSGCGNSSQGNNQANGNGNTGRFSASNSRGICHDKLSQLETYLSEAGYNLSNAEPPAELTWDNGKLASDGYQYCEYIGGNPLNEEEDNASTARITYSWIKNANSDKGGRDTICQGQGNVYLLPDLSYHETLPFGDPSFVGYQSNAFYNVAGPGKYSDQLVLFIFKGDQCYQVETAYVNARADVSRLKDVGQKLGAYLGW
ncbi:MAG: hypothetical protein NTX24_00805 [Candidatus Pacearchaeota archaeon]|nr:hypothetical protein [Candidatus Pacearchaeota archaeon]